MKLASEFAITPGVCGSISSGAYLLGKVSLQVCHMGRVELVRRHYCYSKCYKSAEDGLEHRDRRLLLRTAKETDVVRSLETGQSSYAALQFWPVSIRGRFKVFTTVAPCCTTLHTLERQGPIIPHHAGAWKHALCRKLAGEAGPSRAETPPGLLMRRFIHIATTAASDASCATQIPEARSHFWWPPWWVLHAVGSEAT